MEAFTHDTNIRSPPDGRTLAGKARNISIEGGKTKGAKLQVKGAKLALLRDSAAACKAKVRADVADGNDESGAVSKRIAIKLAGR